ncbi:MAG: protein kinase [Planctomycetes bacterium]|nr:protein kinase [Planctomycetota bacterium]
MREPQADAPSPRPEPAPDAGGLEVPGCRILEELGSGLRGTVYRAAWGAAGGQRTVALKVLRRGISIRKTDLARLQKTAPDRLRHPCLNPIEAFGETTCGRVWYASPLLHGDPLRVLTDALRRGAPDRPSLGPLAVGPGGETRPDYCQRVVELFAEAAEGLALAHREGVVHRRLSGRNLVLTPAGRLVITDFGGDASTEAGDDLVYRAPEQLEPYPEAIGPEADVYALGVLLHETLTRAPLFEAESPRELKELIFQGFPRRGSGETTGGGRGALPRELEPCVRKAMATDPADRYADAGELAADLRRFLRGEAPLAALAPARPEPRPSWKQGVLVRAAAAAALLFFAGGLWLAALGLLAGGAEDQEGRVITAFNPGRSGTPVRGEPPFLSAPPHIETSASSEIPEVSATARSIRAREPAAEPPAAARAGAGRGDSGRPTGIAAILPGLPIGPGEPTVRIDGETFLALLDALEASGDEDARSLLCAWDLEVRERLDAAPRPAVARLEPNLEVALGPGDGPLDSRRDGSLRARWIRTMARLDPSSLVEAAPRLAAAEDLLVELAEGLETAGTPGAREALARLARERAVGAGQLALDALSRLGAHREILDIARGDHPLALRELALRRLGAGFAGLYLAELRALTVMSPDPSIRRLAFQSLEGYDEPDAVLAAASAVHDPELEEAALRRIAALPDAASAPVLLGLLGHPDRGVRSVAAASLAASKASDILLPLASRRLSPRREVREAALAVLLERGELTRIPGAMTVIFGSPAAILAQGAAGIAEDVRRAVLELAGEARRLAARIADALSLPALRERWVRLAASFAPLRASR